MRSAAIISTVFLVMAPASALGQQAPIAELLAMTGECRKLTLLGKDQTDNCLPIVFGKTYQNERIAIMAMLPNAVWSFVGTITEGSQVAESTYTILLDESGLNLGDGIPPASSKTTGTCEITRDPNTNVSTFLCRSGSGATLSEMTFESDGSPVRVLTP